MAVCFLGRKPVCSARILPRSSNKRTSHVPRPNVVPKTGMVSRFSVPEGSSTGRRIGWLSFKFPPVTSTNPMNVGPSLSISITIGNQLASGTIPS